MDNKDQQSNITEFYDKFVAHQSKIGVSVRHRIIFNNLRRIGLAPNSNVLEIGCGIGTASSLIINHLSEGKFLGCDISPESIKYANEKYASDNVNFLVDDMSTFHSDIKFDFVVFPDVLEHIPVEQHNNLFKNVSAACTENAKILINIPEPNCLNYVRKTNPEVLQVIDQSLSMRNLVDDVCDHGFELQSLIPYSIHNNHNNYVSIVFVRNGIITSMTTSNKFSQLIQNLKVRFLG